METDDVGGLRLEIKMLRERVDANEEIVRLQQGVLKRMVGSYSAQQKALEAISALLGTPRPGAVAN